MKINLKKVKLNQVLLIISIVIVSMWLVNRANEKYEEEKTIGPTIEIAAEEKKMSQAELDAVLKFIK
mgnify:CR=1 FL=1|jgi:Na+-transporting methylmalonyl-CoA/oxaloacetate decarboxylase gamma subunit